ncbi:undecaprenyl-phosphate glucose phosphotransferase [Pedobacter yulinensis]|uniref:Undecaprenyl-phosphate glucose phosphotransferase n=1 Tax=Pedobacter yulinensis TaxID=2126353 RepID=A0A2T3HPX4_9SPHI|nr:undecaprenyl-phosphate glucose phosphotransferase [Pedobacter yulinensis]PST84510.1 undecaprenyl-phosphate glucose phosphotransferase [Pedobacter yulinensis]
MQTRNIFLLRMVLSISDLFLLNIVFAFSFYFLGFKQGMDLVVLKHYLVVFNLLWLLSCVILRMYSNEQLQTPESVYRNTWRAVVIHVLLLFAYIGLSSEREISWKLFLVNYGLLSAGFVVSRLAGTVLMMRFIKKEGRRKQVAVLGRNKTGMRLAAYFKKYNRNYAFEGFLDEKSGLYVNEQGEIFREASERGINEIYVSLSPQEMASAGSLVKEAEKQCLRLKFVPDITGSINEPFDISYMDGFPVISLRSEPLEEMESRFKKRLFDMVFSTLVIVFVLSWLYPIIALAIKLQSRGPVLFKQLRSGRDNRPFWCFKFRSMYVNNDSDSKQARKGDARITPIGRFLRKTSLDELPQFFNVLMGEMSVVGPRPHMLKHTEEYSKLINGYMARQFLKPGITGWAQVNGFRGETTDPALMEKRVEHDLWYMEKWTAMLDVKIVFMTIINIIKGEEAAG